MSDHPTPAQTTHLTSEPPTWLPAFAAPDLWLDPDHAVQFITYPGQTEPYGCHVWHRPGANANAKGWRKDWCLADVWWRDPESRVPDSACWQVVRRGPLHLEPSILCGRCGAHGFIRGGRWDPAS